MEQINFLHILVTSLVTAGLSSFCTVIALKRDVYWLEKNIETLQKALFEALAKLDKRVNNLERKA